ncbi:MAG: hypothetical protein OHK0023_28050 [Anaerolineae bacterium]
MRVAVITSWATDVLGGSGTAVFFNAFINGLRSRNYDVDIIAPNFDTTDYVEVTLKRFLFNAELRTDPRIIHADVVIGFDYDGYALDPETRPPMIASAHAIFGDLIQWETDPVRTMVQAQAYFDAVNMHQADWVTAGSAYARNAIVSLYGVAPTKVETIPHGLMPTKWLELVNAAPRLPNARPTVLSVGKMYPRKRTDLLLRAIPYLREKYPTLDVRIAGDGLMWDALHVLADELGVNEHVTWLSHVADDEAFAREWRQADVFCHPSLQESFGFVYVEAMMAGKPIVAMNATAAPEVVGDAGLLVEPENPQVLADALDTFLSNPELAAQYAARGRVRAAKYTVERMMDGYQAAIERVTRPFRLYNYIAA